MVARKFLVRHDDSIFDIDYETDDGFEVFKFQLFSLTSVPPDEQKIVRDDDERLVLDDSDLSNVSEKLRLLSFSEENKQNLEAAGSSQRDDAELLKSDEELARMLQAEEEALMFQQFVATDDSQQLEQRIRPYISQVMMYEDPARQEAARKTVPVNELEERALVALAKEGNFKSSRTEQDHSFLLHLLFWFKQSFRWVNAPPCDSCGCETIGQGMAEPIPSEIRYGATRVELYRCKSCSKLTRFPRYNDPAMLLETRKGRCGEWANCFTLYCRAFGYESRLILDFTDHVWTECYSQYLGRWMHLDPCEGVYDKPLLYEKGWNKKLNYVIAIAKDGVYDVTKRYTRKWHEVLSRRTLAREPNLASLLTAMTKECRRNFSSQVLTVLEKRDTNEREGLENDLHSTDDDSLLLPGRQSGDKEWRISRLEAGSDSWSSSVCPIRLCNDHHVTRIYDAFSPILHKFVEDSITVSKSVEVFKYLKEILLDLKSLPYKTRRVSIKSSFSDRTSLILKFMHSFAELFDAVSLKSEVNSDGTVDIFLAGDPVRTSLALEVALDALHELVNDLNKCGKLSVDSLSLPVLRLNRISSGSVLASGEELPFGIATAAFDGTRTSKWEEPNGAKGCWIMYKLPDNQMQELVAYELMSANDAPERDPMDWVLEGSNDGGSSWHVFDERTSQVFDGRFQRKTYKTVATGFLSHLYRLRFLRVKDGQSTSRLQLGSIDFYARHH